MAKTIGRFGLWHTDIWFPIITFLNVNLQLLNIIGIKITNQFKNVMDSFTIVF